MKKTKPNIPKPVHITLLATLFLMGLVTAFVLASYNYNPLVITENSKDSVGYDAMGYGRGMKNGQETIDRHNCLMDGCLLVEDAEFPVEELDEQTIEYLELALADERKALATYEAVMSDFGKVRPFINISRAEEQHISMLKALYDKYGLDIPEEEKILINVPETLQEACAIGVEAEIENDAMYQGMIGDIEQEDIKDIFTSLAAASKEKHLPAFEKCSEVN